MTTPNKSAIDKNVTRKPSFTAKLSNFFQDKPEKKAEKNGEVRLTSAKSADLPESDNKTMPQQTSVPLLSPWGDSGNKVAGTDTRKIPAAASTASAKTPVTTTTATATTTTTTTIAVNTTHTSRTTTSSTFSGSDASAEKKAGSLVRPAAETIPDHPGEPRAHWLHYAKGQHAGKAGIVKRGRARQEQVEVLMRSSLEGHDPENLFRRNTAIPKLWMKEFFLVSAPLWKNVLQALEEHLQNPEFEEAANNPDKRLARLETVFKKVLSGWISEYAQEGFSAAITPAMQGMAAELRYELQRAQTVKHRAQAEKEKRTDTWQNDPTELFENLIQDLLVSSLAEAEGAPQPLTRMFANYVAGYFGRSPREPNLFRQSSEAVSKRIGDWGFDQRLEHASSKFDPAKDLLTAGLRMPLQKAELLPTDKDFAERLAKPMKQFLTYKNLAGMDPGDKTEEGYDVRFIPPLNRDFRGESATWHWKQNDKSVDITKNRDIMSALFSGATNAIPAQLCCTQNFYQVGLDILLGDAAAFTPFRDIHGRAVAPLLNSPVATWTIERRESDSSYVVSCDATWYQEQVQLFHRDKNDQPGRIQPRLVVPGWLRLHFEVNILPTWKINVTKLNASAWNLDLLEGVPPPGVEESSESESGLTNASVKRLSQKFKASFSFRKDDEDAAPATPRLAASKPVAESKVETPRREPRKEAEKVKKREKMRETED